MHQAADERERYCHSDSAAKPATMTPAAIQPAVTGTFLIESPRRTSSL